jgi:hypothetical protein
MKHRNHFDEQGELRDIFAALAMQGLIDGEATPKWVATQAYKYADMMLEARDEVSHNSNQKETLINE